MAQDFDAYMPDRIKALPRDPRGYPIPFFVHKPVGGPVDFRVMSPLSMTAAVQRGLCWICGGTLGRHRAFVGGPLVAGQRLSAEPPSHLDCAEFAVRACPFLAIPSARRREAGTPAHLVMAGNQVSANPEVTAVCIPRGHDLLNTPNGPMFRMREPVEVLWFHGGQAATRAEVLAAIDVARRHFFEKAAGDGAEAHWRDVEARLRAALPTGV